MTQLDLAMEVGVSIRHLSFLETGRALPSRKMLSRIMERLAVPSSERNYMLVSAGYAPVYPNSSELHPASSVTVEGIRSILKGHEPYPAIALDRYWKLVAANSAFWPLLGNVDPLLLQAPINVLRLSLHPGGLACRTANLEQWRMRLLNRLHRQIELTADPSLVDLMREMNGYPACSKLKPEEAVVQEDYPCIAVLLQLERDGELLSFFTTTTTLGDSIHLSVPDIAIEVLFPANHRTGEIVRRLHHDNGSCAQTVVPETIPLR